MSKQVMKFTILISILFLASALNAAEESLGEVWGCNQLKAPEVSECKDNYFGGCTDEKCSKAIDTLLKKHRNEDELAGNLANDDKMLKEACGTTCEEDYIKINQKIREVDNELALRKSRCAPINEEIAEQFSILESLTPSSNDCIKELEPHLYEFKLKRCRLLPPDGCDTPVPVPPSTAMRCGLDEEADAEIIKELSNRERALCLGVENPGTEQQYVSLLRCDRDLKAEDSASCPSSSKDKEVMKKAGLCKEIGKSSPIVGRFLGTWDIQATSKKIYKNDVCLFGLDHKGECSTEIPDVHRFPIKNIYERLNKNYKLDLDKISGFFLFREGDETENPIRKSYYLSFIPLLTNAEVKPIEISGLERLFSYNRECSSDVEKRSDAQAYELRRIILASLSPFDDSFSFPMGQINLDHSKNANSLRHTDCIEYGSSNLLCWALTTSVDPKNNNLGGETLEVWRPWALVQNLEEKAKQAKWRNVVKNVALSLQHFPNSAVVLASRVDRELSLLSTNNDVKLLDKDDIKKLEDQRSRDWIGELFTSNVIDSATAQQQMEWWLNWYPLTMTSDIDPRDPERRSCWFSKTNGNEELYCGEFGKSEFGAVATPIARSTSDSDYTSDLRTESKAAGSERIFDFIAEVSSNKNIKAHHHNLSESDAKISLSIKYSDSDEYIIITKNLSNHTKIIDSNNCDKNQKCLGFDKSIFLKQIYNMHRLGATEIHLFGRSDKKPTKIAKAVLGDKIFLLGDFSDEEMTREWKPLNDLLKLAREKNWFPNDKTQDSLLECMQSFKTPDCIKITGGKDLGTLLAN